MLSFYIDIVYILANGLVILNTDLYNASNKKKMSKSTFVDVVQAALGSFSSMVDVEYLKVITKKSIHPLPLALSSCVC